MTDAPNVAGTVHVAIDARALSDASRFRGVGTYVRGLLTALGTPGASVGPPEVDVAALAPAGTPVPDGVVHVPVVRHAPDRWATVEHRWLIARELDRITADVNHSPALDPLRRSNRPWVQTVPDVLPLEDPHAAFEVERRRWQRWAPRVREADAVITFSHHGADQVSRLLGVDRARIHVIPLAAGPGMVPDSARREQCDRPFLLYVGEFGPHKGYREAAAVARRVADLGVRHRLVLAGRLTTTTRPAAEAEVAAGAGTDWPDRVELAGWVEDVTALYQSAAVVIVTSSHEGFGLPAVEAMACGTPVVAFDNSATPEVVGCGGRVVPDGDVDAMARVVSDLILHPAQWEEAAQAALRRASNYSWADTARRHVDVYRAVACG